jgi:SAM-dependent methyltransferase
MDSQMDAPVADPAVAALVERFTSAASDQLDPAYQELVSALWQEGGLTPLARGAAGELVARLPALDEVRQGQLAILLGLLTEAAKPDTGAELVAAIRRGVSSYLRLWERATPGRPLWHALLYLLAHFPDDREPILAVAADRRLDPDDLSRLDRALQHFDPVQPVIGRVFPAPSVWALDQAEREFDQAWIAALPSVKRLESWLKDTRTVLGHLGAKAYWAVRHRAPVAVVPTVAGPGQVPAPAAAAGPAAGAELFRSGAAALRCPACHAPLRLEPDPVGCPGCSARYRLAGGILDLSQPLPSQVGVDTDLLMKLSEMPSMGRFYEQQARPAFLRVSGSNWGGLVTPADERDYLARHTRPVAGPVLDLGAGAGTWTAMLAEVVGAERVIALDMALPMLTALRQRLPAVPAVRATARDLPFADASLGAVNCWNALQAFPDDAPAAIAEIGRCLRPGGTLTLLTYQQSPDPVYRHFVSSHHFPQHQAGLRLFDLAQLRDWLAGAGLAVRHQEYPGTFVVLTAVRNGRSRP